jgi:uncharacterized protein YndB with AHSA1/START domain
MDWTSFTRKIRINASAEEVYVAWTNREKICQWFLAECILLSPMDIRETIQKGDKLKWTWHNYPNTSEIDILEATPCNKLVFTFGAGMEVSVILEADEEWTLLTLIQYNIPTDAFGKENYHIGCRQAWSSWLMNLKSWLEFGNVLHDTDLGIREDLFHFVNT